jgi:hypothetical protein
VYINSIGIKRILNYSTAKRDMNSPKAVALLCLGGTYFVIFG